jgi:hypothetical protein
MRTPEEAALVWFRAYRPGTYRFVEPEDAGAEVRLFSAEVARGAPLLLGTGLDPTVRARGGTSWRTIGLAVAMPGWDYLFVAAGGTGSPGMRVRDAAGGVLADRTERGVSPTAVAGVGPSLRFRVREPGLVRLELKGRGWQGYALLRRASN